MHGWVGDVVLRVNGAFVPHVDALGYRLATIGIGRKAEFEVLSRNKKYVVSIALASAPETVPRDERKISGRSPFAGARVANLSPAVASEIGLKSDAKGVVVLGILRGSPASRFGLRARDIVREINDEKIQSSQQFQDIAAERTRYWEYTIERKGRLIRQVVR